MQAADHARGLFEVLKGVGASKSTSVKGTPDPTVVIEDVPAKDDHGDKPTAALSVSNVTTQNLFRNPDTHPLVLDLVLLKRYGHEWLEWEPESLEVILPADIHTSVSDANFSKINACKTLHLVDQFWQRWEVFVWCTMALNGVPPDFHVMQVPTFAQCLVAVDIANRIREDVHFSSEVYHFIYSTLRHDGMVLAQEPVSALPHEEIEGVDLPRLEARWRQVRSSGKAPSGDTLEDEQLRRMLVVHGFLEESRTRLRHQLELIHHA